MMARLKKNHSKKAIKFAALFLAAIIISQLPGPGFILAAGPRFNTFTPYVHEETTGHDYFLLDVKNETKYSNWGFPVSADAGDTLVFYFYYHNATEQTSAQNTTLRVSLPSGQSTQHTVTAYLWADNAENATPSSPLSQSVQVNLSSSQTLEYISGSAKWFPNRADWRYDAPTSFPSGQSGEQLFSSGINIGSVQGCWEYTGAIVFKVKVGSGQAAGDLSVNKTVRNLTAGQSYYSESVNANSGDRLMFQIQVQNISNTTLYNVIVRDSLPSYISYVSGTTRLDGGYISDGIVSGGINIGSLSSGSSRTITFEATISTGIYGSQTLINYAFARADQVGEKSDSASVYLYQGGVGSLNISKLVRNITAGQSYLTSSTNANPNDRVLFSIQISVPSGNQINNVRVWDIVPSGLTFVSGSARLDGSYLSDSLISGGVNLGSLYSNQNRNITFEATINSGISNQTLTNNAYVSGDNTPQQSAYAQVVVGYGQVTPSNLYKRVANLTRPNGSDTNNEASIGDILEYTISYTNTTGSGLNNVQIFDVLPSYTAFQSVANNGYFDSNKNNITWYIGTLAINSSVSVSYRVRVQTVPPGGIIITNTALLRAQGISDVISNETRTTVLAPIVKGEVKAITGANSLVENTIYSLMMSLAFALGLYLVLKHTDYLRLIRLRLAILRIKAKKIM